MEDDRGRVKLDIFLMVFPYGSGYRSPSKQMQGRISLWSCPKKWLLARLEPKEENIWKC